jgi:hypothetical protein
MQRSIADALPTLTPSAVRLGARTRAVARPLPRWVLAVGFWTLIVLAYSTRGEIRIGSYQWVQIPWLAAFKASVAKWCPWALLSGAIYWLNRKLPVAPDALVKRLLIHLPLSIVFTIAYTYGHCQVDENRLTRPQEIAVWSRCGPDKSCRSSEIVRQLDNAPWRQLGCAQDHDGPIMGP